MKRIMVFVDGSNLYHGLKQTMNRTQLDIGKFIKKLAGADRELVRAYYYNAPVDQATDLQRYKRQQSFFEILRNTPDLELVLGRLEQRPDGRWVEKGVDIKLAVAMLSKAYTGQYDVAVLVSGDGDFAEAVQAVKDLGRKVEVAYFARCYHLKGAADRFILLDANFLQDCWSN